MWNISNFSSIVSGGLGGEIHITFPSSRAYGAFTFMLPKTSILSLSSLAMLF